MSVARFVPSVISELAADQTDATISVGAGGLAFCEVFTPLNSLVGVFKGK